MGSNLNATAASLLGFLHEGPMTGWDLVATAQERIGDFWSLNQSQVYRELARMAETGLVVAGERGTRDKQPYSITEAGRQEFLEWMRRMPGAETIRFPLLLTLAFGRFLSPSTLSLIVGKHRALHAERLEKYRDQRVEMEKAGQLDDFASATLDFGLTYEQTVLDWFDRLPLTVTGRL